MRRKIIDFFETFIVIAILLVLVQTFLEDFAVLAGWSWRLRRILIITGFAFDLLFTVEFLIRYFSAFSRGEAGIYFLKKRGWIDFLASIPLLLLNSGPSFLALMMGGGIVFGIGSMLNILKIVKAIRIARILRLLRILKIFRQIKYIGSTMAQRHITKINTLSISTVVFTLFVFSLFAGSISLPSIDVEMNKHHISGIESFFKMDITNDPAEKARIFSNFDSSLLIAKQDGKTVYSRYDNPYYKSMFGPTDYIYVEKNAWIFFFDMRSVLKVQSVYNILFFLIVIVLIVMFIIYYSPHFALTVTDPIHVMKRGFLDRTYNLEVEIPDKYRDDDIFILGDLYNKNYLPLKQRERDRTDKQSDLSLDDIQDIFE